MAKTKTISESKFIGKKLPSFKIKDQHGEIKSQKDFEGSYVLMYFYPKDSTPGCTTEACQFRDNQKTLTKLNLVVVGVSADDEVSHKKFSDKYNLPFTLLADTERKLIEFFELWVEKSMYGKKYMGIQRDSFLISPEGKVLKHYVKVKPETHVDEVIEDLKDVA